MAGGGEDGCEDAAEHGDEGQRGGVVEDGQGHANDGDGDHEEERGGLAHDGGIVDLERGIERGVEDGQAQAHEALAEDAPFFLAKMLPTVAMMAAPKAQMTTWPVGPIQSLSKACLRKKTALKNTTTAPTQAIQRWPILDSSWRKSV